MYPKIKTVLFASDLTENSREVFHYAAIMGMLYKIEIIILHIIEKIPLGMRLRLAGLEGEETLRQLRQAHEQAARRILIGKKSDTRLRRTLVEFYSAAEIDVSKSDIEIKDIIIKEGNIAEEIINSAVEHECGLIVIGAHKGLLGATALGSVTRTVLQRSKVPVLVVPPSAPK